MNFYYPKPTAPDSTPFKLNLQDNREFRIFIEQLSPDANIKDFKSPKINLKLVSEYSILLISKVNADGKFARVIAEICGKISEKNRDFPISISTMSKKIYSLLVRTKKSVLGFLEFYTMLNVYCKCRVCLELVKFAFFHIFEDNSEVDDKTLEILEEYLIFNEKRLETLPHYIIGDMYYQMKVVDPSNSFYSEQLEKYDPIFELLTSDGCSANPSLRCAMNFVAEFRGNNFESMFDNPKDLQVVNPKEAATFFIINATLPVYEVEKNMLQVCYASLVNFIEYHCPNSKNVKIFIKNIVDMLKLNFFTHHILKLEADDIQPELIIGTSTLITELYKRDVISYNDFKIFLKAIVSRHSTDINPITEACNVSLLSEGYMKNIASHHGDNNLSRFIQLSVGGHPKDKRKKPQQLSEAKRKMIECSGCKRSHDGEM